MANSYDAIIATLKAAQADVVKGYAGNKAASTRARLSLQEVKNLLGEARKELLACGKKETDPQTLEDSSLFTPEPKA